MKNVVNLKTTEIPYEGQILPKGRIRIRVEGIEPLLTHNPEGMLHVQSDAKRGTRIPAPEDEAESGCYRLPDGQCAIKADMFIQSIAGKDGAAGAWKGKNRSTMKSRLKHIVAQEGLVGLFYPDGTPIREYVIDRQTVIVQKARIVRARPRYDQWSASFTVEYDSQLVAEPKMIVDIAADAGSRIGVGDHRPRYGRFRIVSYSLDG